jgi:hypothetical protein
MITDDLRHSLIEAICRVPVAASHIGRTGLLGGIHHAHLTRNETNDRGDVMVLVAQLEDNYGANREWRLLKFIDNAAKSVAGTELERELGQLRSSLLEIARPRAIRAAETAQVHLFDLRPPVMTCVGKLQDSRGLSGFVVPAVTPRLVKYFCNSLQYWGAVNDTWSRDQVAATRPLLVIEPMRTEVSYALTQAKKIESLLAAKHVFLPIYVANRADADALWQGLSTAFPQPTNRFIVVFGVPDITMAPAAMTVLPSPEFKFEHIANWAADIAKANSWSPTLLERWTTVIVMGCEKGKPLPIDYVYDRLEQYHELVNSYREDEYGLLQVLKELEMIGE